MSELNEEEIYSLINRRRRQILVHSIIYYKLNSNVIPDSTWAKWAIELEELQAKYPDIAARAPYAQGFANFEHSSGYNLPLNDSAAVNKAHYILQLHQERM